MDFFDILLAKKLEDDRGPTIEGLSATENGTYSEPGKAYSPVTVNVPLPTNANERKSVTSYPVTDSANYPLPKVDVTVTDVDKCEVIVTTDNTITEDSGVYIERQSGGGNRELDAIVGGSIVWNQLVRMNTNDVSKSENGVTIVDNRDGTYTVSTDANGATADTYITAPSLPVIKDHVYCMRGTPSGGANNTYYSYASGLTTIGNDIGSGIVGKQSANATAWPVPVYVKSGTVITTPIRFKQTIIDLTALFGSTIADYIYTLEQATAGSGIAWLKSYGYLTEDYYGYTANKIESVSVARHVMKDSNDSVIGSYAINPITLRGIPKLNASNQLYYDGDVYEASGRVTRKYDIVDLGSLTYTKDTSIEGIDKFNATLTGIKNNGAGDIPNTVSIFTADSLSDINYFKRPNEITNWNNALTISATAGAYSDATAFKTAMNGVYLIYELATPTTESTSPFEANQIVDANGTEEYIDAGVKAGTRDVAIPVGHDTKYYNGEAYVKSLTAGTSDTVSMADMGIMPTSPMYISANGSVDVEYWKSN